MKFELVSCVEGIWGEDEEEEEKEEEEEGPGKSEYSNSPRPVR